MQWADDNGEMRIRTFNPATGFYSASTVAVLTPPSVDPDTLPAKLDEYIASGEFMAECLSYDDAYYTCTCGANSVTANADAQCQCWMNVERENWVTALMEIGADRFNLYVENNADQAGFSIPELFYILGREALVRAKVIGAPPE